ncbi:MAG: hypothetical protein ACREQE_07635 [Candidatus Binataceae bacterium]
MAIPNFGSMQSALALVGMGQLLNADFGALLNRAQSEEVDNYNWSFILTNTVVFSAAPYSTGTISVAQGSAVVNGTGTLWTAALAGFQIRFGASGMLIQIASVQNAAQLTLSTPWMGAPIANSTYAISQSYYPIPGAKEITAIKNVIYLGKLSREALNLADPQRLSVGGAPALNWAPAPYTADGTLQVEMWPVPSGVLPYVVEYRQTAVPMVSSIDIPMVPAAVLEAKAMKYACDALYASSGDPRYGALAKEWNATYADERDKAQHSDKLRELTQSPPIQAPNAFGMDYLPEHDPY